MLTLIIWWTAILLEATVVFRGFFKGLSPKYPFFYVYITSVLLCDILLYFIYQTNPHSYPGWSRGTEVLNIVLGYGIVLEIFEHLLSQYRGAERFARISGLIGFGAVFCFAIFYRFVVADWVHAQSTSVEVERDFLAAQAVFLFVILGVIFYYSLSIGKNLRGMLVGYILWLGTSLMTFSLRSYVGASFNSVGNFLEPFSYLLSLLIWLSSLWSYHPNPISERNIRLATDYDLLVSRTRTTMEVMRSYLTKAARL